MRNGDVHFVTGSAYAAIGAFPAWNGLKFLCALSQHAYWFMAVRSDLNIRRGDRAALKGLRISASSGWPALRSPACNDCGLAASWEDGGASGGRGRGSVVPRRTTRQIAAQAEPPKEASPLGGRAGPDFMVDVIRSTGIDFI